MVKKFDTESKTQTFQAREFVIEVADGNYPQMVKFQLTQDKCSLVDPYEEGDTLRVHFDLRGREWNGKYFTNLNAWRIENGSAPAAAKDAPPATEDFPSVADAPAMDNVSDDLPF